MKSAVEYDLIHKYEEEMRIDLEYSLKKEIVDYLLITQMLLPAETDVAIANLEENVEAFASMTGFAPGVARSLLRRQGWSLNEAIRIAVCYGIDLSAGLSPAYKD